MKGLGIVRLPKIRRRLARYHRARMRLHQLYNTPRQFRSWARGDWS